MINNVEQINFVNSSDKLFELKNQKLVVLATYGDKEPL